MLALRAIMPCSRATRQLMQVGQSAMSIVTAQHNIHIISARIAPQISHLLQQVHTSQTHRCYASKVLPENIKCNDPELGERIYLGTLAPRMRAVKLFSLMTSIMGLAAQPILMEQGMKLGGTPMAVVLCGFGGFFTFVTPFLLHFITKKYVTEIHYNPKTEEYTATTISIILQKIRTKFRPSDVKVPDVPGMFTSFLIRDRPLFVDPTLFDNPDHYVRIMGYDKPIDFKLDLTEKSQTNVKAAKK